MHAHIKDASTNLSHVHVNCESDVSVEAHRAFDARIRTCKGRILGAHCIAEILHLNKTFIAAFIGEVANSVKRIHAGVNNSSTEVHLWYFWEGEECVQ